MIPVFIDTSSLSEQLFLTENQVKDMVDYAVKEVTANFARNWEQEAMRTLKSTRNLYVRNINVIDEGYGKGSVVLTGFLPNALESGLSPFDIKFGLLNGPNSKVSKNNDRYNTVPFRFAAPTSLGESEVFSGILPQEIADVIKAKQQDIPVVGGGRRTQGLRPEEIPASFREPVVRPAPKVTPQIWNDYRHKSSIYQGVSRVQDPVTGQQRYQSFRRVSENSSPDAFIHPGFNASNLADKALQNTDIPSVVGRSIDNFLIKNGFA